RERFNEWPRNLSDYPMEITPVVSNFIKHKQIAFVKRREKEQRGQMINEQQQKPIAPKVQQALDRISDIRQELSKRVQA
ncbi:ATP-dependent helicase, partial [Escherichia coli]